MKQVRYLIAICVILLLIPITSIAFHQPLNNDNTPITSIDKQKLFDKNYDQLAGVRPTHSSNDDSIDDKYYQVYDEETGKIITEPEKIKVEEPSKSLISDNGIIQQPVTYIDATGQGFLSTWSTGVSSQITLPLISSGTYNFVVDWGDNSSDTITEYNQTEVTHVYNETGTYNLNITGKIVGFNFNNAGDKDKILQIAQWGDLSLGGGTGHFYGASNLVLTATDAPILNQTTSFQNMFRSASSLGSTGSMNSWNTSTITNMANMFNSATNFNQPIGNWDTSRVTSFADMFSQARVFNQPIGNWNTSSVTSLSGMFDWASSFNQPIGNWDVSQVTTINSLFWAAPYNHPLDNWNTSKVNNMGYTFYFSDFNQDISSWDVSSVTDMQSMFGGNNYFNQPLNTWDVSNVVNMNRMFAQNPSFNQPLDNWNITKLSNMAEMFRSASSFNQPLNSWDTSSVNNMMSTFSFATSFNQPLDNWDVTGVTNANGMNYMFRYASSFNQDLSLWDVSQVTSMGYMFQGTTSFDQDLSTWDISNANGFLSMQMMFDEIALSTVNYSKIISSWSKLSLSNGVEFSGGNSQFSPFVYQERQIFIDNYGWIFTDGGLDLNFKESTWFMSDWNTTLTSTGSSNSTTITLPLQSTGIYNFNISWGDGVEETITSYTDATHYYESSGVYRITINGTIDGWKFGNSGDRLKLLNIANWGNLQFGNDGSYFEGTTNLAISADDTPDLGQTSSLFAGFRNSGITNPNALELWNTSTITDMSYLFSDSVNFNGNVSTWNTQNVLNMSYMFSNVNSFNQDLSMWDISQVTDMSFMFSGVELTTEIYDHILISWGSQSVQSNVSFDAGFSKFTDASNAEAARDQLITTYGWNIQDGGYTENIDPVFLTSPPDFEYNRSTTGNQLVWEVGDRNPDFYIIYRNNTAIQSTTWSNGSITLDIDGLVVGVYEFQLILYDEIGNTATDIVIVEVKESVKPVFITIPEDQIVIESYTGQNISWEVGDEYPGYYEIYINGVIVRTNSWMNGTISYNLDHLALGNYEITLIIYDQFANTKSDGVMITVEERINPDLTSPSDVYYDKGSTENYINWEVGDRNPSHYDLYFNNSFYASQNWINGTISVNVDGLEPGNYNYTIHLFDNYGNVVTDTVWVIVSTNSVPDVSSPSDLTLPYYSTGNSIEWEIGDKQPGSYEIYLNGNLIQSNQWDSNQTISMGIIGLELGEHYYEIKVVDGLGAITTDTVLIRIIDDILPTISGGTDHLTYEYGSEFHTVGWEISDDYPGTYVLIDQNENIISSGEWDVGFIQIPIDGLEVGTYYLTFILSDSSGNQNTADITVVVQDTTAPSIGTIDDITIEEGSQGNMISLSVSDLNPGGYEVYRNGNRVQSGEWVNGQITVQLDGLTAGEYLYRINVYDSFDNQVNTRFKVIVIPVEETTIPKEPSSEPSFLSFNPWFVVLSLSFISMVSIRRRRSSYTNKH